LTQVTDDDLPRLRGAFAREAKRNLFEAFLRPRQTSIKLVSTSISSSAAFPGGEAFHFSFSPNAHFVLAYSTSRIHVIRLTNPELSVVRELKIMRRPASVAILDDGSVLAVLSTDHQVDVYDLGESPPKHTRAISLDHPPRTIALSPEGSVLAAAYDGGIEVYSLSIAGMRRAVKCDAADALSFSQDGTQLLGTTLHSKNPSTVILTAPYFNPGEHSPDDTISQLWTTSILFPNSSRDCSHAILLPSPSDYEASWTFTYDRVFETFRAVRIDDLRNGTTYFTGPIGNMSSTTKLLPSTIPASTTSGDLVAAGFQNKDIWLYGMPEDLDAPSDTANASTTEFNAVTEIPIQRNNSVPGLRASHTWPKDDKTARIPQWMILCDKSRNAFIEGNHMGELDGISSLKWVTKSSQSLSERLIVTAPGGIGQTQGRSVQGDDESVAPVDGGRLTLLDFSYSITDGTKGTVIIQVGEREPEVLEEEHRDMETEVAIVRRRTVAQSRGNRPAIPRTATMPTQPNRNNIVSSGSSVRPAAEVIPAIERGQLSSMEERSETASIDEQEALDAPYAHGAPRSVTTLRRAATAAAINRILHPPRVVANQNIPMRRADGREEHPHESDADNWVPPPPPYSKHPVPPLPEHLRNAITANLMTGPVQLQRSSTQHSNGSAESDILSTLQRSRTTYATLRSVSDPTQRRASVSTSIISTGSSTDEIRPSQTQTTTEEYDDLYDVSPERTPEPARSMPTSVVSPVSAPSTSIIPRRPVGLPVLQTVPPVSVDFPTPISPSPQHVRSIPAAVRDISAISEEWESRSTPSVNSTILTQTRLEETTPARPPGSGGRHLTELPLISPLSPMMRDSNVASLGNQNRHSVSHQAGSTPSMSVDIPQPIVAQGPSVDQLARLNSRSGRPDGRFIDPSRRGSGTFVQPQFFPGTMQQSTPPRHSAPVMSAPCLMNNSLRAAAGAHISPNTSTAYSSDSSRRSSTHRTSSSQLYLDQNARPRMTRLETIHSIGSQMEVAGTFVRPVGVSRQQSRAERSAAINLQEARRRGWRGTMKKRKKKQADDMSSAGWTDISRDSFGPHGGSKKEGKCLVM
jgi:hypothetical protein